MAAPPDRDAAKIAMVARADPIVAEFQGFLTRPAIEMINDK